MSNNTTKEMLRNTALTYRDQIEQFQKTAIRMAGTGDVVPCPEGCHFCCETKEHHVYEFQDALVTTLQNYPLLSRMYHTGQLRKSSKRCPALSLDGKCMIYKNKPDMCTAIYPVNTKCGKVSCKYCDEALGTNVDFTGTNMSIPFHIAAGMFEDQATIGTIFPEKLTERRFSGLAEGSRWVIENLPNLISKEIFSMMVEVGVHAEAFVQHTLTQGVPAYENMQ